jgi:hypothetical protein
VRLHHRRHLTTGIPSSRPLSSIPPAFLSLFFPFLSLPSDPLFWSQAMSDPTPSMPAGSPVAVPIDHNSTVWERISTWVSEHKAVVYTVAGVAVVVTGAGVVYYLNNAVCLSVHCLAPSSRITGSRRTKLKVELGRAESAADG